MAWCDRDRKREYQRTWKRERRLAWIAEQGGKCMKCGNVNMIELEVDHVDPCEKVEHRIWSWSRERREEELKKCQVLCKKCHDAKEGKEDYRDV